MLYKNGTWNLSIVPDFVKSRLVRQVRTKLFIFFNLFNHDSILFYYFMKSVKSDFQPDFDKLS